MRGQASIETLLILAAVLSATAGLVVLGQRDNERMNVEAVASAGVENAIAAISAENECSISVDRLYVSDDTVTVRLFVLGSVNPSAIENEIETRAESFLRGFGYAYSVEASVKWW